MKRQKLIGWICGASLSMASCATVGLEQAAPAGPQFPLSEAPTWADVSDDGFNRLVIDFRPEAATSRATTVDPGVTSPAAGQPVGDRAHLYNDENGDHWALLQSGDRVRVELGPDGLVFTDHVAPAPEPLTGATLPAGSPAAVAALEADPRIDRLTDLGDGTWAVVTTMTADELTTLTGQAVSSDALMALSTDDPYYDQQWSLENVGNEGGVPDADVDFEGSYRATDANDVVVAVIDTGVDFSHPDLLPSRWQNPGETNCSDGLDDDNNGYADDCHGWDFADGDPTGYDPSTHWHGTHIAGTIAAAADNGVGITGLSPGAQIMDLRVVGNSGTSASIVAAAIRYAVDNGAQVVNLSLGTRPGAVPASAVAPLADAIEYANLNDVVVVAAAGNDSTNIDNSPVWPASLPHANLVTVGSSTWYDSISSFSNTGAVAVDLFAPGSRILATDGGGGYRIADGTSMAAPHVAAAAALILAAEPGIDARGVRDRLMVTADAGSGFTSAAVSGARLNASNAAWGGAVPASSLSFAGFSDLSPDQAFTGTISVDIVQPEAFGAVDVVWEATLLTRIDGETLGVMGHPVTTSTGPTTSSPATASFALSGIVSPGSGAADYTLGTTLPEGDYALVVQAVPTGHPGLIIGEPQVLFFAVGDPTPPPPSIPETTTTTTTTPTTTPSGDGTGRGGAGEPESGATSTTTLAGGGEPDDSGDGPGATGTTTTTTPPAGGTTEPGGTTTTTTTTTASGGGSEGGTGSTGDTTPTTGASGSVGSGRGGSTTTSPSRGGDTTTTTTQFGQWRIDALNPGTGPLEGGNYTTIDGSFPQPPFVWIGEQLANVLVVGNDELLVLVPSHSEPGPVDVTLRTTDAGEVLRAIDAYTYVGVTNTTQPPSSDSSTTTVPSDRGDGGASTSTTTGPAGSGADETDRGSGGPDDVGTPLPVEDPTPEPPPGSGGATDGDSIPTTTTPAGGGGTTLIAPGARNRLHMGFGETQTVGSLSLAPVSGGDPFAASNGPTWSDARCTTDPCRPRAV
ncbi:MAG: S8 family serine peptidase [Actinomycetia bacterium]|nr:S8 family serine peptidase [Actinomycetes bacterium]